MDATKPVTPDFTKSLPKVELHAHLTGSISRQCLHEIWTRKKAQNPDLDVEDPLVVMPPGKVDYTLSTFFTTFSSSIYNLCSDLPSISYATNSVLESFYADGIRYLELRTIPRSSPSFTKEEYLSTVLSTIHQFHATQSTHSNDIDKSNTSLMKVTLILAIDRANMSPSDASEIIDLAISHSPHVVGIDICGNPTKGALSIFTDAIARAKAAGLGLTVHLGEVARENEEAALREELETILLWEPDRLGHVIHVPPDLKTEIKRRGLGLELCMSCNVHARMFDGGFVDHHFGEWWGGGECVVVLCTDDVGFFCSPVSNEYLLAAEHFNLTRDDLLRMCRRSFDVIFGGEDEKRRLRGLLDDFESNYTQ